MVRGFTDGWKQQIFYKYDQNMTKDIMNKIISKLFDVDILKDCYWEKNL